MNSGKSWDPFYLSESVIWTEKNYHGAKAKLTPMSISP